MAVMATAFPAAAQAPAEARAYFEQFDRFCLATGGDPAVEAARESGRAIRVATFDLSPGFLEALQRGEASFAVDPQAWLQGYLGTVLLANRIRYGVMPANPLIETGPRFVTQADAGEVLALSKRAIR